MTVIVRGAIAAKRRGQASGVQLTWRCPQRQMPLSQFKSVCAGGHRPPHQMPVLQFKCVCAGGVGGGTVLCPIPLA